MDDIGFLVRYENAVGPELGAGTGGQSQQARHASLPAPLPKRQPSAGREPAS